jgi:hypothetical protein
MNRLHSGTTSRHSTITAKTNSPAKTTHAARGTSIEGASVSLRAAAVAFGSRSARRQEQGPQRRRFILRHRRSCGTGQRIDHVVQRNQHRLARPVAVLGQLGQALADGRRVVQRNVRTRLADVRHGAAQMFAEDLLTVLAAERRPAVQ